MRRALLVAAALIGGMPTWSAIAQQADDGSPRPQPQAPAAAGQTDAGADPANSDNLGATGWTGSWSANEGAQQDEPGTATTDQTKPMPPVPPGESPPK